MDALQYLNALGPQDYPDVIYIDPMFPHSKKSALVKKEMRVLREVVGDDDDAAQLLLSALKCQVKRVVVKRSRYAPAVGDVIPNYQVLGKSSRYDIYLDVSMLPLSWFLLNDLEHS